MKKYQSGSIKTMATTEELKHKIATVDDITAVFSWIDSA